MRMSREFLQVAFLGFALAALTSAMSVAQVAHPSVPGTPDAQTAFVPKETTIVVQLQETVSSYDASAGQALRLIVINDVVSNGLLIAKAGDDVEGKVVGAVRGKPDFGARGGDLKFQITTVHNYCGDPIAVHFTRSEYRNPNASAFLSKLDVTVDKGQRYGVRVAYPQKVCG